MIRHQLVGPDQLDAFSDAAAALERTISYPLGNDRFTLDHGADYFAFFRRLGEPHVRFAFDDDKLIGMATTVLRKVPFSVDTQPREAWYLCDFKLLPEYQARGIALPLVMQGAPEQYQRCPHAYAISMNPPKGINPLVRLVRRWFLDGAQGSNAGTLNLYSLDAAAMAHVQPELQQRFGRISYRSLAGMKDVVLQSTRQPMNLWHVQHGPAAQHDRAQPVANGAHMFCAAAASELARTMGPPMATATLLHHGMADCDWSFVLSSDI